jgi:hypothetical protein
MGCKDREDIFYRYFAEEISVNKVSVREDVLEVVKTVVEVNNIVSDFREPPGFASRRDCSGSPSAPVLDPCKTLFRPLEYAGPSRAASTPLLEAQTA